MTQLGNGPLVAGSVGARRERLRSARLYLVTDDATPEADLPRLVQEAVAGGAEVVQLRRKAVAAKDLEAVARRCCQAAHEQGALFLVNDHPELALRVGADGVHLGQEDLPPQAARELLGPELLVGLSTHDRAQLARTVDQPVDYISAGPVRETPSKPGRPAVGWEYVRLAAAHARVPVVAIGGLGPGMAAEALRCGADLVGVVRAICSAVSPRGAAEELRAELGAEAPWVWLQVNGSSRKAVPGETVSDLLERLGVDSRAVVVELNLTILRGEQLRAQQLREGDALEVVRFVGGGSQDGR
ncbi:MAG: thiamine phosphate synthase [Candidatus Dormibacteria bacterium]